MRRAPRPPAPPADAPADAPLSAAAVRTLQERDDAPWEARVAALHALEAAARAPSARAPGPPQDALLRQLRVLAPALAACISDLRSTVVKEACLVLRALAELLGAPFVRDTGDPVISALLARSCTTKAVVRDSSVAAARAMFEHGVNGVSFVTARLLSRTVLDRKLPPSMRAAAAHFVGMMLVEDCLSGLQVIGEAVQDAIVGGCKDPHETVRAISRDNWRRLDNLDPASTREMLARISPQIAALIVKETNGSPSSSLRALASEFEGPEGTSASTVQRRAHAQRTLPSSAKLDDESVSSSSPPHAVPVGSGAWRFAQRTAVSKPPVPTGEDETGPAVVKWQAPLPPHPLRAGDPRLEQQNKAPRKSKRPPILRPPRRSVLPNMKLSNPEIQVKAAPASQTLSSTGLSLVTASSDESFENNKDATVAQGVVGTELREKEGGRIARPPRRSLYPSMKLLDPPIQTVATPTLEAERKAAVVQETSSRDTDCKPMYDTRISAHANGNEPHDKEDRGPKLRPPRRSVLPSVKGLNPELPVLGAPTSDTESQTSMSQEATTHDDDQGQRKEETVDEDVTGTTIHDKENEGSNVRSPCRPVMSKTNVLNPETRITGEMILKSESNPALSKVISSSECKPRSEAKDIEDAVQCEAHEKENEGPAYGGSDSDKPCVRVLDAEMQVLVPPTIDMENTRELGQERVSTDEDNDSKSRNEVTEGEVRTETQGEGEGDERILPPGRSHSPSTTVRSPETPVVAALAIGTASETAMSPEAAAIGEESKSRNYLGVVEDVTGKDGKGKEVGSGVAERSAISDSTASSSMRGDAVKADRPRLERRHISKPPTLKQTGLRPPVVKATVPKVSAPPSIQNRVAGSRIAGKTSAATNTARLRMGGARRSVMPGTRIKLTDSSPIPSAPRSVTVHASAGGKSKPGTVGVNGLEGAAGGRPRAKASRQKSVAGRTGMEKKVLSKEIQSVVDWMRQANRVKKSGWLERCEALDGFGEACKNLQGGKIGVRLAEDCIGMLGDYIQETHHRVATSALDGLFFLLLCSEGSSGALQKGLERRDDVMHRVLSLIGGSRENLRLAAGRVMQSVEVQFRPEVAVALIMRGLCGGGDGRRGGGDGSPDGRVAEAGCNQLAQAFERAAASGEGFLWKAALLEDVVRGAARMRQDRRAGVRHGAARVVTAVRGSLPPGALELACGKVGVDLAR